MLHEATCVVSPKLAVDCDDVKLVTFGIHQSNTVSQNLCHSEGKPFYTSDVRVAATARTCWIPVCELRQALAITYYGPLTNLGVLKTGGRQVQFAVGVTKHIFFNFVTRREKNPRKSACNSPSSCTETVLVINCPLPD